MAWYSGNPYEEFVLLNRTAVRPVRAHVLVLMLLQRA